MVIIFERGNVFWIESIDQARASIASGGQVVTDHAVTKAGIFLGGSVSFDSHPSNLDKVACSLVETAASGTLSIGDPIEVTVRACIRNEDNIARTLGLHIILFMRGRKVG